MAVKILLKATSNVVKLDETHPENVHDSYWLHSVVINLDLFIKLWNFNYCLVLQDCLTFHFLNFHQFFSNSATHKRKANCAHYNHSVTSCCFDHKMCIFNLSQKKLTWNLKLIFILFGWANILVSLKKNSKPSSVNFM